MKERCIAYAFHYCLVGNVFLVVENSEVRRRKKKKYEYQTLEFIKT